MKLSEILTEMKPEQQCKAYYSDCRGRKNCFNGFIGKKYKDTNNPIHVYIRKYGLTVHQALSIHVQLAHFNDNYEFSEGHKLAIKYLKGIGQ